MKRILITILLLIGSIVPQGSSAQTEQKVYVYDSIVTKIAVNSDSTFVVEEQQLFNYQQGKFHQGWRSIPLDKVSRITDVSVIDGATGQSLQYSPRRLDKNDPDDWNKYATYRSGGSLNIEWYYDLSNTQHLWVLRYTVHGGLTFYKENDRIYWNIFSGYDVPVGVAVAEVSFPTGTSIERMKFDAYRTKARPITKEARPDNVIRFEADVVDPGEAFTIDILFPKGVVQKSAFWKDWLLFNYGYVGSVAIVVFGILFLIAYWYRTERYGKGRGVIIAQYEPPRQLRPAMAEVLVKETITNAAWPATIVDLAVRGYVRISEEERRRLPLFGYLFSPKGYVIEKNNEFQADNTLEEYERKFLELLFMHGDRFAFSEVRRNALKQQELAKNFNKLKDLLYQETDGDTKAFENGTSKGKYIAMIVFAIIFLFVIFGGTIFASQVGTLVGAGIAVILLVTAFIKFEPRLSKEGYLLKEDWLGFKLYLETAERYRMQNLTPDIFEKYLPYAMIFGIEKQWAKAFEGMSMQSPRWYGSSYAGGASGGPSGSSFSPIGFSSSFASSFSSAFASSGGGGGGSAGGGGGGGGGGAS